MVLLPRGTSGAGQLGIRGGTGGVNTDQVVWVNSSVFKWGDWSESLQASNLLWD